MIITLYLLIAFNMIDVYCSIYLMEYGAIELNPIMGFLLQWPSIAIWIKLFISIAFSICIWKMREHKIAHIIMWIAFIPYCILAFYYIFIFIFLL